LGAGTVAVTIPFTPSRVVDPLDPSPLEAQRLVTVEAERRPATLSASTVALLRVVRPWLTCVSPEVLTVSTPVEARLPTVALAAVRVIGPPPVVGSTTNGLGARPSAPVTGTVTAADTPNAPPATEVTSADAGPATHTTRVGAITALLSSTERKRGRRVRLPVGERHAGDALAVELDELAHDLVLPEHLGDGQHQVCRGEAVGR